MVDAETADELMSSFEDHYEILQSSLNKLIHNSDDAELINLTFRSMHTIKGNAAMMQVTPLVIYSHAVEETISAMRAGFFKSTPTLCDLLLTAIDRLRDLHAKYLFGKEVNAIDENAIAEAFSAMANARSTNEVEDHCQKLTCLFSPGDASCVVMANNSSPLLNVDLQHIGQHDQYLTLTEQQQKDLLLFRILSIQVDDQNHFWQHRTDLLLYLGLKTLALSDKPVNQVQLVAGIYLHDLGMAFVTDSIVNKNTKLNAMETKKLQQHPVWGYELASRMSGWDDAAQMVLQHHERIDGEGYPHNVKGDDIAEGAKLIAILDAYYAMTNLRADRSHRRSILRAVAEINACTDTQFCAYWVDLFNQVIRQEAKSGNL